jgi:hypothetical protein
MEKVYLSRIEKQGSQQQQQNSQKKIPKAKKPAPRET